jgi:hypothetical protein
MNAAFRVDPEGGTPIPQRFIFSGRMPGSIAWPRRIEILNTFSAGPG